MTPSFRRPLGVVLAGGGALGAWQAGFLGVLTRRGLGFEKILGFSVGALTGAGYFLRKQSELIERWRDVDRHGVLRLRPRLRPFSLFSGEPVWAATRYAVEEAAVREEAPCELIVMCLRSDDGVTRYFRFAPRPNGGRSAALQSCLVASCAIPWVFPPVLIREDGLFGRFVDGGVPGREWMRLDALADCKDIIVAEMVRPEETGRHRWSLLGRYDQRAREICREQVNRGIESLRRFLPPPRIFRVFPSRRLGYSMLAFRSRHCGPALSQGMADAEVFLENPERWLHPAFGA